MTEEIYLGIDTSCYTTSLFFMDRQGRRVAEARRILKVKPGGCGLQQSEMLYQHTRNLPELMEEAVQGHTCSVPGQAFAVRGIGVSARPRPREDSYMPAFLAGLGFARSLAALYKIPLWQISHQENHLEAAAWSAKGPDADRFLFLHASGGTTDLLLAERIASEATEKNESKTAPTEKETDGHAAAENNFDATAAATSKRAVDNYTLTEIGSSLDLHAGQFVDRVGVALGLGFPAGPALEQLAAQHTEIIEIPVSVHKTEVSFSGPCTWVLRKIEQCLYKKTEQDVIADNCTDAEQLSSTDILQSTAVLRTTTVTPQNSFAANIAAGVQWGLAETFIRMIRNAAKEYHCKDVLLAGGVASNQWIRNQIIEKLAKRQIRVWLPEAKYSGDNAAGCAAYAWRQSER